MDELPGCRGVLFALPLGLAGWGIIIALLLFVFSAFGQEATEFVIESPTTEVAQKLEAHDDEQAVKRQEITELAEKAGASDLSELSQTVATKCEIPQEGVVLVHQDPIRVINPDTGELSPISLKWEPVADSADAFINTLNTVTASVQGNGGVRITHPPFEMNYWPLSILINGKEELPPTDPTAIKQTDVGRVEVFGAWPLNASEIVDLKIGGVKESVSLPDIREQLEPEIDPKLVVKYGLKTTANVSQAEDGSEVYVRARNGMLLGVVSAPVVTDAAKKKTVATLGYTDGVLTVSVDADWLDSPDRVYPVLIDPTVDSGQASVNRSVRAGGAGSAYQRFFMKFDLPAINGTCDGVELRAYLGSYVNSTGSTFTVGCYTAGVSVTTGWDGSSTGATLNGLTMYTTGVSQAFNVGASPTIGWYSWTDIKGTTDVNSIKYAYDDGGAGVCDPGLITIQLRYTTGGSTAASGDAAFTTGATGDEIRFDNPGSANGPILRITYTGTLSCSNGKMGSGSAGMMMGKRF